MPTKANSYDEVPYESHAFPQTHPDRLATVASLLGLNPPAVQRSRVLELGCASGGNLIPMAAGLPDAQFVGVDLSERQIADGQKIIHALGLKNIALKHTSILDIDASWGAFDYILCHGVYSWVPPPVQDKILSVCQKNLSPEGVAYVSYNTYPGWHMRSMIRRMMLYHASQFREPKVRVQQARALLKFLTESASAPEGPHGLQLKSELDMINKSKDSYLLHEHLEEFNEPLYFNEFIARAQSKELQYLGEADLSMMLPSNFSPKVRHVLQRLARNRIHVEQYMDFLRNRMFRQTLLCHQSLTPKTAINADRMMQLYVASRARPESPRPDLAGSSAEIFSVPNGTKLTSRDPLVKTAMAYLCERWPQSVAFADLAETVARRLSSGTQTAANTQPLAKRLLNLYGSASNALIEFNYHPARMANGISARPKASPLARLQATRGMALTSLRHEPAAIDEFGRQLLCLLDGASDHPVLVEKIAELVRQGVLVVRAKGPSAKKTASLNSQIETALLQQLHLLQRKALLLS